PCPAGGHDQTAFLQVTQLNQRLFDQRPFIRYESGHWLPGAGERLGEKVLDRWPAQVLILPAAGAIGNGHNADPYRSCHHCSLRVLRACPESPVAARFQRAEPAKASSTGTLQTCRHCFPDGLLLCYSTSQTTSRSPSLPPAAARLPSGEKATS